MAKTPKLTPFRCQISIQVRQHIIKQVAEDVSFTHIAQENNVSVPTVVRIMNEAAQFYTHRHPVLPKSISFDEVRTGKKQMSFIAVDAKQVI